VSESRHPGISYHKLPVGGDVAGFLFVIAAMVALAGKAHVWGFLMLSLPMATLFAVALHFVHRKPKPPISLNL